MYLNQIIVLQKHIWELSEQNNRLARMQNTAEKVEVNAELSKRINKNGGEQVETLHAIALLKMDAIRTTRDELYDALPVGDVSAFDLVKLIKKHIAKLDELINTGKVN